MPPLSRSHADALSAGCDVSGLSTVVWNDFENPFYDDFSAYKCVVCVASWQWLRVIRGSVIFSGADGPCRSRSSAWAACVAVPVASLRHTLAYVTAVLHSSALRLHFCLA